MLPQSGEVVGRSDYKIQESNLNPGSHLHMVSIMQSDHREVKGMDIEEWNIGI